MAAERRVAALSRHLTSAVDVDIVSKTSLQDFDANEVYRFLTRDNLELRAKMLDHLKDDIYKADYYLSLLDFRELTLQRLKHFVDQKFFSVFDYLQDPLRFMAGLETLASTDYSLCIKAGVHFTLCGGTIAKLGTKKHHAEFLPRMDTLDLPGCFGMTELGHGSNVMGIETQATYDEQTGEFVIQTPRDTASKFWIGGAAQHGKVCTVFAQLTVRGKWEGPHVFVVRLRDDQGRTMPGVRILDNGAKAGLNGVDNGQLWFNNVRVPRDALLDRYASVAEDGTYSSPIPSVAQRFGTMVGGLTTGRMLIAQGAIDASKIGVTIALRYACARPQFQGKRIMEYLTHQRRLLPALATIYAMQIQSLRLKALYMRKRPEDGKQIHVISSSLKAGATWHRVEILQACRECCGGQGFLAANKIGPMKNDMDVDVTFEGDNTVMMQQVAKALLDTAAKQPPRPQAPSLQGASFADLSIIASLLRFQEDALTAQIGGAMAQAAKGAASQGKKAAAAAATDAYEDNLDLAVALGWAFVDRVSFEGFVEEVQKGPANAKPALTLLATLYGLTRVERRMAFYLAAGVADGGHAAAVRSAVNAACAVLSSDGGWAALRLAESFGIPDHCLQAPIAFDWRQIGSQHLG
ncbi:g1292 [Coccomyxa viridis]|uniref:Acyl-coenzyme A oxidase n=1 Tax=Coccomyxa viridis TaxID=1274662 RepID=A0ABP1FN39_9CHLO